MRTEIGRATWRMLAANAFQASNQQQWASKLDPHDVGGALLAFGTLGR